MARSLPNSKEYHGSLRWLQTGGDSSELDHIPASRLQEARIAYENNLSAKSGEIQGRLTQMKKFTSDISKPQKIGSTV